MSTPLGAAQEDLEAVERIVRAAGTSFYRGMRVLPPDRRVAMYAIYAFCRIVDDIADDDGEAMPAKRQRLDEWRRRIADLYVGRAGDEVVDGRYAVALGEISLAEMRADESRSARDQYMRH